MTGNDIGETDGMAERDGRSWRKRRKQRVNVESGKVRSDQRGLESNDIVSDGMLKRDLLSAAERVENRAIDFSRTECRGKRRESLPFTLDHARGLMDCGMRESATRCRVRGVRDASQRE